MWKHRFILADWVYRNADAGAGSGSAASGAAAGVGANGAPAGGNGGAGGGNGGAPGAGGQPVQDGTWYGKAGISAEHHEWLGSKQFADPNLQIASHRSLETLIGRQRLAVPANAEDKEAHEAIYKSLGRPDKPDGYKLPEGSKISGDEWKNFAPIFHEAGVSQAQAERILAAYEKRGGDINTAAETERLNEETRQTAALDAEWGSAAEANKDIAARAFRALGIDEATSDKIEAAIGYQATMKLFHKLGSGMSEAQMRVDGGKGNSGGDMGGSLEGAKGKLKAKFDDPVFMAKYMNSDPRVRKGAIEEVEAIQKTIADHMTPKA